MILLAVPFALHDFSIFFSPFSRRRSVSFALLYLRRGSEVGDGSSSEGLEGTGPWAEAEDTGFGAEADACPRERPTREAHERDTFMRCTSMRCMLMRCMPIKCSPVREAHERDMRCTPLRCTPVRCTSEMHTSKRHAYEGFCEDLARQNTVAHLSQLQLGFRRCRIWVSVIVVVS